MAGTIPYIVRQKYGPKPTFSIRSVAPRKPCTGAFARGILAYYLPTDVPLLFFDSFLNTSLAFCFLFWSYGGVKVLLEEWH